MDGLIDGWMEERKSSQLTGHPSQLQSSPQVQVPDSAQPQPDILTSSRAEIIVIQLFDR